MEFDPRNNVIQLCVQGIALEEKGEPDDANRVFLQAWNESANDYERFISAYYVARHQRSLQDKLTWLEKSLHFALAINDVTVRSAFPALHTKIAECYEESNDVDRARENYELADSFTGKPSDPGPFYHGTRADLDIGDLLKAGGNSNYKTDLRMNHIYFTAIANGAGLAAALATGDGRERVYIVEPTGSFENDPNVTDKKFPGNPTRSYRSQDPLKVVAELTDWARQTPGDVRAWREKLKNSEGEIIN